MKKNKSIDIIMPYWGDPALAKKTIHSVLSQTVDDWRLIILDDCYSSNEIMLYINELSDERIAYYRHKKNIGITENFNYAIKVTEADYCVIVGCDDIMLNNYVETALKNIGDADFYQPSVQVIDADDNIYLPLVDRVKKFLQPRKHGIQTGERLAVSLCTGNWLYFPSILWKTSTLKKYKFDPTYKIAEDLKLELEIILDGGSLYFGEEVAFQYRRFSESLSSKEKSKGGVRFNEERAVYKYFESEFKKNNWIVAWIAAKLRLTSRLHQLVAHLK